MAQEVSGPGHPIEGASRPRESGVRGFQSDLNCVDNPMCGMELERGREVGTRLGPPQVASGLPDMQRTRHLNGLSE